MAKITSLELNCRDQNLVGVKKTYGNVNPDASCSYRPEYKLIFY